MSNDHILSYMDIVADFESTDYGWLVYVDVISNRELNIFQAFLLCFGIGRSQDNFFSNNNILTHLDLGEISSKNRSWLNHSLSLNYNILSTYNIIQ